MSADPQFRTVSPDQLSPRDMYRLFTSIVVPRPIAWIATRDRSGRHNLAPFSFFNAVGGKPPVVMVSIGSRRGVEKDTLRNLRETGECIIHTVDVAHANAMNITSAEVAPEIDEFELANLDFQIDESAGLRRLVSAPIAMLGRAFQFVPVSTTAYTVALIEINRLHIRADLVRDNGLVDPLLLDPLGRLGGEEYWERGQLRIMPRPR